MINKPKKIKTKQGVITAEQVEVLKIAFNLFDTDSSGEIDDRELRDAMKALGFNASQAEVTRMIQQVDKDGSGTINMDEFLCMMKEKVLDTKDIKEEMEKVFKFIDHDNQNTINFKKLKTLARDLGEDVPEQELKEVLESICGIGPDSEQQQEITKEQFFLVMNKMKLIPDKKDTSKIK